MWAGRAWRAAVRLRHRACYVRGQSARAELGGAAGDTTSSHQNGPANQEGDMEGVVGVLAVAGGFGLALGLTVLGMNLVLGIMPTKRRNAEPSTPTSSK